MRAPPPPLEQRIKAIDPQFISRQRAERVAAHAGKPAPGQPAPSTFSVTGAAAGFAGSSAGSVAISAAQVAQSVGNVTTAHIALAENILAGLPADLLTALRAPESAPAVCHALVLCGMDAAARPAGLQLLRTGQGDAVAAAVEKLLPAIAARGADGRLALGKLAVPPF